MPSIYARYPTTSNAQNRRSLKSCPRRVYRVCSECLPINWLAVYGSVGDVCLARPPPRVRHSWDKNQVVFHDVAAIEVKPHVKKNTVAVELTDFSVFYSQDSIANAEATLKDKGSKIVVERGQIVKVSKDAKGIVKREVLTSTGRTGSTTGRWISTLRASARSSACGATG